MLEQALENARDTLANDDGRMDEREMCKEVIVSVFRELDWNIHDVKRTFRGQYPIRLFKNKPPLKADYALFAKDDAQNPLLLIEAKRPGEMKDADDQVNTYLSLVDSANAGIATDGRDWRIYLRKRRLALEFSIENGDLKHIAELLPTVLGRGAVESGKAVDELEKHYKQTQAERHFDKAWSRLDGKLLGLFIEEVKRLAGTEPLSPAASAFLKEKFRQEPPPPPPINGDNKGKREPMPKEGTLYLPDGRTFPYDKRAHAIKELMDCAHGIDPASLDQVGKSFVKRERAKSCIHKLGEYWVNWNISDRDAPHLLRNSP